MSHDLENGARPYLLGEFHPRPPSRHAIVLNNSKLLHHTPNQFRGRIFAALESIRWPVMIVSMAAAGIASQYTGPRTAGLVAGALGSVTAIVWAWWDWSGRLPEPKASEDGDVPVGIAEGLS